jgi:hypothetical protein
MPFGGAIIFGDLIGYVSAQDVSQQRIDRTNLMRSRRTDMLLRSFYRIAAIALIGLVPLVGSTQAKRLSVVDTFIQKWDVDHDGTLSLDEVKKAASARFDELDRDHDGTLDRRELGATVTAWQFRRTDTDKDGTLDKNEYLAMVEQLFRAADKDHDGTLDRKELNSRAGRVLLRLFGPRQGPLL